MKRFSQYILEDHSELNAFVILKPEFLKYEQQWLDMLTNNGWQIVQKKKCKLTHEQAEELYKMHKDKDFYKDLCNYMSSDECICCSCHKDIEDPIKNMKKLKDKARDAWGKSEMKNAMHSSDSLSNVKREANIVFK